MMDEDHNMAGAEKVACLSELTGTLSQQSNDAVHSLMRLLHSRSNDMELTEDEERNSQVNIFIIVERHAL